MRGADEAAQGRAQMLALADIQRQETARDQNVAAVSQAAQRDLGQGSGQEESFKPIRRSRFGRRRGWDPVHPGYAPIPLGLGYTPNAASSSLGLAPMPPVAQEPALLAPAAASADLPTRAIHRTRIRGTTPAPR